MIGCQSFGNVQSIEVRDDVPALWCQSPYKRHRLNGWNTVLTSRTSEPNARTRSSFEQTQKGAIHFPPPRRAINQPAERPSSTQQNTHHTSAETPTEAIKQPRYLQTIKWQQIGGHLGTRTKWSNAHIHIIMSPTDNQVIADQHRSRMSLERKH